MSRISALYDAFLRKEPRQSRSRSVVEAILNAASERLARSGDEEDLTLQDVAKRAGVGIGSLYDYFVDRRSLLAALAAKLIEDNRRAFEDVLATTHEMPLEQAIERIIDFSLEMYTTNKRVSRTVLKMSYAINLIPLLAQSQNLFAESLASALRKRSDVTAPDIDAAAWTVTQAMMGIIHMLVWVDDEHPTRAVMRADALRLFHRHLGG